MTQSDKKEEKNKEAQKAEPTSEKEKKLNRKVADKLKFYGVVTVLSLLCAGFIWFIFKPDTPETVEGMAGINTTIPDAIAPETMADKQKAYELEEMKKRNEEKAKILYDFLDSSKLFHGTVVPKDRSLMNVPFVTGDADLDAKFVAEAKAAGFENLKGHRTVGGMRASIYNAMPKEGVEKLVEFMKKFEKENA